MPNNAVMLQSLIGLLVLIAVDVRTNFLTSLHLFGTVLWMGKIARVCNPRVLVEKKQTSKSHEI